MKQYGARRFVREYAQYIIRLYPTAKEAVDLIVLRTERGNIGQIEAIKALTRIAENGK